MKNRVTALATALSLLAASAVPAVEEHHPPQQAGKPAAPAKPAPDKSVAPGADMDKQMRRMQERAIRVHELMHKLQQTRDPGERERLMQEMRQAMQENMRMMHGMMGPGMMEHMHPMHDDPKRP